MPSTVMGHTTEDWKAILAEARTNKSLMLTVGEAAKLMNVSRETIRRWIANGALFATRVPGGHFRVPISSLAELVAHTDPALVESAC